MDLPRSVTASSALLSLNEVLFHLARAGAGAGAPVGICEEFAAAASWLAFIRMDPARAALPALDALARGQSSDDLLIREGRIACREGRMVSAIFAGPVIMDRLSMEPAEPVTLQVDEVDVPLLLAGAAAASGSGHVRLVMHAGAGTVIDVSGGKVAVKGGATCGRAAVTIVTNAPGTAVADCGPLHVIDEGRKAALEHGIAVDSTAWSGILAYYYKTLVPSTERSRNTGAGPADGT